MVNNKLLFITLAATAMLGSCVEPVEPEQYVPDVLTDNVVSVSLHEALIAVADADYDYHERFLEVDATDTFSEPLRVTTMQGDSLWVVSGLQTDTRYVYREVATDGLINRYGPVRELQTLPAVEVKSLSLAVWNADGQALALDNGSSIGFFYTNLNTGIDVSGMSNLPLTYDNATSQWRLPIEIEPTATPHTFYMYSPYSDNITSKQRVPVGAADKDVDFLYGSSSEVTLGNFRPDVAMHHVQAKLLFAVTLDEQDNVGSVFNSYTLKNYEYGSLPVSGLLDLTTGKVEVTQTTDSIARHHAFTPSATAEELELYVLPCDALEYIQLVFDSAQGFSYSVNLPPTTWEAGKQYTYPVSVRQNKLVVGDVIVEPWRETDAGSIVIYN